MGAGRPSKYSDDYPEQMLKFFDQEKSFRTEVIESMERLSANGTKTTRNKYKLVAEALPTFEKFAHSIGVHYDTLREWATATVQDESDPEKRELKNPDFSEAYNKCKQLQKDFLIQNGLMGLYPAASFIFVAKNITDMQDVQVNKNVDDDLPRKEKALDKFFNTLRDHAQSSQRDLGDGEAASTDVQD